jgi:hypothetical protein
MSLEVRMRELMHGLSLEGQERCPAGVEWVVKTAPASAATASQSVAGFCYRSEERSTVTCRMRNLEQPIVLRFINARIEQKPADRMQKFLGTYGFPKSVPKTGPLKGFESVSQIRGAQKQLRRFLRIAGSFEPTHAIKTMNQILALPEFDYYAVGLGGRKTKRARLRLLPKLEYPQERTDGPTPRLVLAAESLFDYMIMECAFVAMVGARTATCSDCRDLYLTGPLTGRRSHSLYCSDACRVRAMRKRRANEA